MYFNNNSQSETRFLQFLQEIASDYGFSGNRQKVFMMRFDLNRLDVNNINLTNEIKWNKKKDDGGDPEDTIKTPYQSFQDHLKNIIKEFEKKDNLIVIRKPGRPEKGKSPWQQLLKFLMVEFKRREAEQECNPVSEPDNLLPRKLEVYVKGKNISRHYEPGYEKKELRVVNKGYIKGEPGGYIACYSRNPEKGVYCVGDGIYVIGLIWMKGSYIGRIFIPDRYEGTDISTDAQLKQTCNVEFPPEGGEDCWPGGDTGGFLGYA